MRSEFEEKEYEAPLIHQLAFGTTSMWSPGQVFEGNFGIDAAIEIFDNAFWSRIGLSQFPSGVILDDLNFGRIWRRLRRTRQLPNYNLNLFLQVKRPESLSKRPRNLSALGLRTPYWRFTITQHQQILLEKLNRDLSNRAFVAYACPAFHTYTDLFNHTRNNTLPQNSTFVKASKLTGHSKWVYHTNGSTGIACSEPQRFNDENFLIELSNLAEQMSNRENGSEIALRNLEDLKNEILTVVNEENKNPIAREILIRNEELESLKISSFAKNYLFITNFCRLTNCNWLVIK
jgi:hypothetical protein